MALSDKIISVINWLYIAPISRIVSRQTFRYAICGGSNMGFNFVLYAVIYNFIIQKKVVHLGFVSLSAHITTYWIVFPIIFYTGFWLNKYITFTESNIRTRTQLIRYFMSVLGAVILGNVGLKFFVDIIGLYPTPSYIIVTCISVVYSYAMQRYFTFMRKI